MQPLTRLYFDGMIWPLYRIPDCISLRNAIDIPYPTSIYVCKLILVLGHEYKMTVCWTFIHVTVCCYTLINMLYICLTRLTKMIQQAVVAAQHYSEVILGTMASQTTSLTIVYTTVYSGADQGKHQSSASLAFVRGINRGPGKRLHLMTSLWWGLCTNCGPGYGFSASHSKGRLALYVLNCFDKTNTCICLLYHSFNLV